MLSRRSEYVRSLLGLADLQRLVEAKKCVKNVKDERAREAEGRLASGGPASYDYEWYDE